MQFALLCILPMMGQVSVEEQIKRRAAERVGQMNDYISFYNRENEMCIFSKRNVHFLYFFRGFPARS